MTPNASAQSLTNMLKCLFPAGYEISVENKMIRGEAMTLQGPVAVLGTTEAAEIDHQVALALADGVLDVVEQSPGRPIIFLVDTAGQALSRRDEVLCLNGSFAHLAACVELARSRRHPLISLVTANAVSGAFLAFGMMADQVYAIEGSRVRVIHLKAMARVTKIEHTRLVELSASSPIFAPGPENYRQMGAIEAIWEMASGTMLESALARGPMPVDSRMASGLTRNGRVLAESVAKAVESGVGR